MMKQDQPFEQEDGQCSNLLLLQWKYIQRFKSFIFVLSKSCKTERQTFFPCDKSVIKDIPGHQVRFAQFAFSHVVLNQ